MLSTKQVCMSNIRMEYHKRVTPSYPVIVYRPSVSTNVLLRSYLLTSSIFRNVKCFVKKVNSGANSECRYDTTHSVP